MTDQDARCNSPLPEAPFSTNAYYVTPCGMKHQITARGTTAQEMTSNYFAAVDTLKAAYAQRAGRAQIDTGKLLALVACGMEKAAKQQDFARAQRLVKAAALVQAGAVAKADEGYTVASQTDPSKGYWVAPDYACTCEDSRRGTTGEGQRYYCKHALASLFVQRLTA